MSKEGKRKETRLSQMSLTENDEAETSDDNLIAAYSNMDPELETNELPGVSKNTRQSGRKVLSRPQQKVSFAIPTSSPQGRAGNASGSLNVHSSRRSKKSTTNAVARSLASPIVAGYRQILALDPRSRKLKKSRMQRFNKGHKQRADRKKNNVVDRTSLSNQSSRQSFERKKVLRGFFFKKNKDDKQNQSIIGTFAELLNDSHPDLQSKAAEDAAESRPPLISSPLPGLTIKAEDEYNEKIDEEMQQHLKNVRRFSLKDKDKIKAEMEEAEGKIESIRKRLLSQQEDYVENTKISTNNLLASLRAHLKLLEMNLKIKMEEYGDLDKKLKKLPERSSRPGFEAQVSEEMKTSDVESTQNAAGFFSSWFGLASATPKTRSLEIPEEALRRASGIAGYARECVQKQHKLLKQIRLLSEQIEILEFEIYSVETEHYFPKRLQWKLRLNAGDYFLGLRDIDFDSIKGDATLKLGEEPGVIFVNIRNIAALIGISNLTIRGSSIRSKLSNFLFTPTVNRLDIGLSGDWTLVLRFEPASEANNWHASWKEDEVRSSLKNLKLNREMSGLSALRLPTKWIEYIATSLIPQAVNTSIKNLFSPSFGSTLLDKVHNKIVLEGQISFEQHIQSNIFRAPLIGQTKGAETARKQLNLSYEEAVYLDSLMRGKLGTLSGYKDNNVSIERLRAWRLQYAAHPLSRLKEMCSMIQKDTSLVSAIQAASRNPKPSSMKSLPQEASNQVHSNFSASKRELERESLRMTMSTGGLLSSLSSNKALPKPLLSPKPGVNPILRNSTLEFEEKEEELRKSFDSDFEDTVLTDLPENWLFEILDFVEDLSMKRVRCKLELTNLACDLDLNNIVRFFADTTLIRLESKANKAESLHAKKIAGLRKAQVENRILQASDYFKKSIFPMLSKNYQTQFDAMIVGGLNSGVLGIILRNLTAGLKLGNFSVSKWLGWSAQMLQGYIVNISGTQTEEDSGEAGSNAYSFKFRHCWRNDKDILFDRSESEEDGRFVLKDVNLNLFPKGEASGTATLSAESIEAFSNLNAFAEFFAYWGIDAKKVFAEVGLHFSELSGNNPTEGADQENAVDSDDSEIDLIDKGLEESLNQVNRDRTRLNEAKKIIDDEAKEDDLALLEKLQSKRVDIRNEEGRDPIFSANPKIRSKARYGNMEDIKSDNFLHPYLPRILLDPYYNLSIFVQNLEARASKLVVPKEARTYNFGFEDDFRDKNGDDESIALSLEKVYKFTDNPFALFQMDWNLSELFDDVKES